MGNKEPSKRQGEWCNQVAGLGLRLPWLLHNVQLAISHRETLQIDNTPKSFVWATEMNSYLTQKVSYAPFDCIMPSLFITVVHRQDPHSPQLQQWQKRTKGKHVTSQVCCKLLRKLIQITSQEQYRRELN